MNFCSFCGERVEAEDTAVGIEVQQGFINCDACGLSYQLQTWVSSTTPPDCKHTIDDIARVDDDWSVRVDERVFVRGECKCGAPTIVTTEIRDVELDAEGSTMDEIRGVYNG